MNVIAEEQLRSALSPFRADAAQFESEVRRRLALHESARDPLEGLSPFARIVASLLPLDLFAARRPEAALRSAPAAGFLAKAFGYAAFPAISLFVVLGSAIFGARAIREIQAGNSSGTSDAQTAESMRQWWRDHRIGKWLLFAATIAMAWLGATDLLFLTYIISTLVLLYVLKSFARVGIGNRGAVGASCGAGLCLLGQMAGFPGIGGSDIHFVDQSLLVPLFFAGGCAVFFMSGFWKQAGAFGGDGGRLLLFLRAAFGLLTIAGLMVWYLNPLIWPATAARIGAYVESFESAEFSSASWRGWENAAEFALKATPGRNLSGPRTLLQKEIDGEQNPLVLGTALRVGLMEESQTRRLRGYDRELQSLLAGFGSSNAAPLTPLDFQEWAIRAAVLRNDLTTEQKGYVAERLHATMRWALTQNPAGLRMPLLATRLLEAVGRPVDPELYRTEIHALLLKTHTTLGGGFDPAGGFKPAATDRIRLGSLEATADAIGLMEIYGVPAGLDMNWVRSNLKARATQIAPEKWTAAVLRQRLKVLPGITAPTWREILYRERSFLAGSILIGLCVYATAISPAPRRRRNEL